MTTKPKPMALLALSLFVAYGGPAHAGFIVNFAQSGVTITATGSGTLDLTALTAIVSGSSPAQLIGMNDIILGPRAITPDDDYMGFTGPSSIGPGISGGSGTAGSGDRVGVAFAAGVLIVPFGYVSGTALSTSNTFVSGSGFSGLGLTPGSYTWTWGSGAHADFFTVNIGAVTVPEPASLPMVAGALGLVGLASRRWRSGRKRGHR
jgi:hypothetical protein